MIIRIARGPARYVRHARVLPYGRQYFSSSAMTAIAKLDVDVDVDVVPKEADANEASTTWERAAVWDALGGRKLRVGTR